MNDKLNKFGVLLSIAGVIALIITIAAYSGGKQYIPALSILLAGLISFFVATLDLSIIESIPTQNFKPKNIIMVLALIALSTAGAFSVKNALSAKVLDEYNYSMLREDIITPKEISNLINRFGVKPTHQYLKNQDQEKSINDLEAIQADNK